MSRYQRYELGISAKRIETLITGIREGMPIKYACDLAFIYEHQYQNWKRDYEHFLADLDTKSGEEKEKALKLLKIPVDKNDNLIYSKLNVLTLMAIVTHAKADCLQTYLKNLKLDPDHFQRWSWLLERTYRRDFGKDVVETPEEKPIERLQVVYINPNEQNERLQALKEEVEENINGNK